MQLQFITWDVDPEIFRVGSFAIRWYGLFFMFSFLFGFQIMKKIFEKEGKTMEMLDSLSIHIGLGTILGARLGHCLFYDPSYYLSHPVEILKIWEGGLASHGAAIGILLSLWFFSRKHAGITFAWIADRTVIVVALAAFFIRIGNLMNSEIVGNVTDAPWGFLFVREIDSLGDAPRHPTQIYEGLAYLVIFITLFMAYFKFQWQKIPFRMFSIFLIFVFGFRFFIEFLKMDQEGEKTTSMFNMGQLLSLPLVIIGIYLLIKPKPKNLNLNQD